MITKKKIASEASQLKELLVEQGVDLKETKTMLAAVRLDNRRVLADNERLARQVKASENKLKALDEAKDDFISMASHQLRTPLTSIKGYISMLLEGDAGKLTPTERKLLKQSFF